MVSSLSRPSPFSAIDPKRIAANAGVLAVHAVAFAMLMLPSRMEAPAPKPAMEVVIPEYVKPPEIEKTTPPPVERIERPRIVPVTTPPIVAPPMPPVEEALVFETGELVAPPIGDIGPPVETFDPGPQLATLAYLANPAPRYPRPSIRGGDEGRVLLRVLVDAQGRPIEVTVEESSGHRELDKAARDQVLAAWRFHPAQRAGVPVPAIALVPIDFKLP